MSAKQRRDPCSGPQRIQRFAGSVFPISFRLSLDPIDRSPLGRLTKFTQPSFPLY